MAGGGATENLGALRLSDFMEDWSREVSVLLDNRAAVIITALAPAGILAYRIWDGKTYVEVTKHGDSHLQDGSLHGVKWSWDALFFGRYVP